MKKKTLPIGSTLEKTFKKLFWKFAGLPSKPETPNVFDPKTAHSILVLRPDRLGDFLLSVPALRALQESLVPKARLTLVAGERSEGVARLFFPNARIWVSKKFFLSRLVLWGRLWVHSFDAVIDFHSYPFSTTSSWLSLLSGSPIRTGFWAEGDFAEYSELSKKVFNHGVKAPAENLPESDKSFLLVKKMVPKLKKSTEENGMPPMSSAVRNRVEEFFRKSKIGPKDKVLGIHPTLQKRDNRWSPEKYIELVENLFSVSGLKVVVIYGQSEEGELKQFRQSTKSFSNVFMAPTNDLFFILEAAKRFDVFVCGDSGLMHACSWATRVVAVFGPSDPKRWGPSVLTGFRHKVFRKKDGLCDSVKPREVAQEVKRTLAKRSVK